MTATSTWPWRTRLATRSACSPTTARARSPPSPAARSRWPRERRRPRWWPPTSTATASSTSRRPTRAPEESRCSVASVGGAYAGYVSFLAGSDAGRRGLGRRGPGRGRRPAGCDREVAGTVTLLRNTTTAVGSITFAAPGAPDVLAVGEKPTALFVADFNRDGWPRSRGVGRSAHRRRQAHRPLRGRPRVLLRPVNLPLGVGDNPLSVTGADFDGDGDIDLATAAFLTDTICIFENLGGSFSTTPIRVPAPDLTVFATAADLNRDGRSRPGGGGHEPQGAPRQGLAGPRQPLRGRGGLRGRPVAGLRGRRGLEPRRLARRRRRERRVERRVDPPEQRLRRATARGDPAARRLRDHSPFLLQAAGDGARRRGQPGRAASPAR